jgi:cysteine desulfurase
MDADSAIELLAPVLAASNGAACTSICSSASHVLTAMQLPMENIEGGIRLSWGHTAAKPHWPQVVELLRRHFPRREELDHAKSSG